MKLLTVLGSTGSIGRQTLEVVAGNPGLFSIYALAANSRVKLLAEQARRFKAKKAVIADKRYYGELKNRLADTNTKVAAGRTALCELAADMQPQLVVNALVGFAGLEPTLLALQAGKKVALANKESLVAGGHLVMPLARENKIIPIDSEHSAIFQCLQGERAESVESIILTASGGPFWGRTVPELENATPEEAIRHPNWRMGKKISVDSATMMNKGLEVIEAHWLFKLDYDKIKVLVQRESIVHSLVTFIDGAVLAQLGMPDMRVPIQYALTYPQRMTSSEARIPWSKLDKLSFSPVREDSFACLALAYRAGRTGGSMPAVMNAANEEAVGMFLSGKIKFLDIPRIIEFVMNKHKVIAVPDYSCLVEVDMDGRLLAREYAKKKG